MIVGIHQPNYIPWYGFFHKMLSSDVFVILDDVLCSNKEERRNVIKGSNGMISLAIPIINKKAKIKEVVMNNQLNWKHRHIFTLQGCYQKAKYWEDLSPSFIDIYQHSGTKLVDLNLAFIEFIREYLDIRTPIIRSSEMSEVYGEKNTKLISICKSLGAHIYLSGLGAKSYMNEEDFRKNNIKVVYQYFNHPVYPQRWGSFIYNLSIVDLLFNCGPNAKEYVERQIIV
ncbi:WbqC family protein [Heyndrickxia camelliae]|uniref:WbqC-like protein n=1 Tax=Heyndrickxia camelliae TaxID=1707093 RepID=A0A2N3LJ31_9BACI|nr:WbqC family protein [Heyndrickxia camelliae]PKR84631.1 hypothetical protein CWO92_13040 [Heyndrickxia camelliae]